MKESKQRNFEKDLIHKGKHVVFILQITRRSLTPHCTVRARWSSDKLGFTASGERGRAPRHLIRSREDGLLKRFAIGLFGTLGLGSRSIYPPGL